MSRIVDGLHGTRILVVEDHDDTREIVRLVLEELGATVTAVESAEHAIDEIAHAFPDLVITDITLKRGPNDGRWLLTRVRATAGGSKIPIVALTGLREREAEMRAAGFDDVWIKPVEDLGALVATLLRRR